MQRVKYLPLAQKISTAPLSKTDYNLVQIKFPLAGFPMNQKSLGKKEVCVPFLGSHFTPQIGI